MGSEFSFILDFNVVESKEKKSILMILLIFFSQVIQSVKLRIIFKAY